MIAARSRNSLPPSRGSTNEFEGLLKEVAELLQSPTKASRRAAAQKLERIAAIATTLAFTIHTAH